MTRTYELGFIVDPRQSDDAVQEIADHYKGMIEASGATVTETDIWGRRKLAYPIQKFNEGKYVFLYIASENGSPPFPEIERLMRQSDQILRYLTVRTDLDLKRAARKGKPGTPGGPPKTRSDDEVAADEAAAADAAAADAASESLAEPKATPKAAAPKAVAPKADAPAAAPEAAADEAPADEAAPVADEAAPVAEETAPVAEETAPVAEETAKAAAGDAPAADDTAAASDEPVTETEDEGDDHGA